MYLRVQVKDNQYSVIRFCFVLSNTKLDKFLHHLMGQVCLQSEQCRLDVDDLTELQTVVQY